MDWNSSSGNLIYFEQGMAHIEHDTLLPLFLRFPRQFREYNSILSMRFLWTVWTNAPIQIFVSSSAKAIRRSDKNASFAMTEKLDTHLAYYSIMVVFNYGTHVPSPKKKPPKVPPTVVRWVRCCWLMKFAVYFESLLAVSFTRFFPNTWVNWCHWLWYLTHSTSTLIPIFHFVFFDLFICSIKR